MEEERSYGRELAAEEYLPFQEELNDLKARLNAEPDKIPGSAQQRTASAVRKAEAANRKEI